MSRRREGDSGGPGRNKRMRLDGASDSMSGGESTVTRSNLFTAQRQAPMSSRGDLTADANALLDAVVLLRDEEDFIIEPFMKLPSKRAFPDYYEIIKQPIAMDMIRKSLKRGEYEDLEAVKSDLLLMARNAQEYNDKASFLYAAAQQIAGFVDGWTLVDRDNDDEHSDGESHADEEENEDENEDVDGDEDPGDEDDDADADDDRVMKGEDGVVDEADVSASASPNRATSARRGRGRAGRRGLVRRQQTPAPLVDPATISLPRNLKDAILRILAYLRWDRDADGRLRWDQFEDMPSKKEHPGYWQKASRQISLGFIFVKARKNPYKTLERFGDDLAEVYKNTIDYYGSDSAQGKDIIALRRISDQMIMESKQTMKEVEEEEAARATAAAAAPQLGRLSRLRAESVQASPGARRLGLGRRESALRETVTVQETEEVRAVAPQAAPIPTRPDAAIKAAQEAAAALPEAERVQYTASEQFQSSSDRPMIEGFTIATTTVYPPFVLHVAGEAGKAEHKVVWHLPLEANMLACAPQLASRMTDSAHGPAARSAIFAVRLNGRSLITTRKTSPSEVRGTDSKPVQHSIYDVRLSTGVNCIEVTIEAESEAPTTSSEPNDRDRERIVVLVHLG
ncbi:hypothetical protein PYCC9005_003019 [Savitreella phatthalungensis]